MAFSLDSRYCELISYIATTAGISGEMIRDLMAETIKSRFGIVDRHLHQIEWIQLDEL